MSNEVELNRESSPYVILMETNDSECESWYYFLKFEGNEENLQHLQSQLEKVDWYIMDDLSTFDLDLTHLVSNKTAKEMTKVDLNAYSFHRKFDGKLERIDLGLNRKDSNEDKICKVFDILGYGQIENYVSSEDIDEEDLVSCTDTESSSGEEDEDENKEDTTERPVLNRGQLPESLRSSTIIK